MITLWVIEDNESYRRNLLRVLRTKKGIDCTGDFADCESALAAMKHTTAPAVILLDLGLPGMGGLQGIPEILRNSPMCNIIVLTVFDDRPKVFDAIAAGAAGYLLKSSTPGEVIQAIEDVAAGGSPLTPQIARYVLKAFNARHKPDPEAELSPREHEILTHLAGGMARKTVADQTGLSPHTVDFHVRNIYKKLHVSTITGAISKAIREELI